MDSPSSARSPHDATTAAALLGSLLSPSVRSAAGQNQSHGLAALAATAPTVTSHPEHFESCRPLNSSEISELDVVSGRGGKINKLPGNSHFRKLCEEHKKEYYLAKRTDQRAVAKAVVNQITSEGGRFLKQGEDKITFSPMTYAEAVEKTFQRIREKIEVWAKENGIVKLNVKPRPVSQRVHIPKRPIKTIPSAPVPHAKRRITIKVNTPTRLASAFPKSTTRPVGPSIPNQPQKLALVSENDILMDPVNASIIEAFSPDNDHTAIDESNALIPINPDDSFMPLPRPQFATPFVANPVLFNPVPIHPPVSDETRIPLQTSQQKAHFLGLHHALMSTNTIMSNSSGERNAAITPEEAEQLPRHHARHSLDDTVAQFRPIEIHRNIEAHRQLEWGDPSANASR